MMEQRFKRILATALALLGLPFAQSMSIEGEGTISHSGKSEVTLSISSEKAQGDFESALSSRVKEFNIVSGYNDAVQVKGIALAEGGYQVKMALRRADKVKIKGAISYAKWSSFAAEGSEARKLVENASKGNLSSTSPAYYDGNLSNIEVKRDTRVPVKPYTLEGEALPVESFLEEAAAAKNHQMMFFARAFDVGCVTKIRINVPGKLRYYGGEGVTIIDEDTLEITPVDIPCAVVKTIVYVDEDGVEKTKTERIAKPEAKGIAAYFIYDKSMSPVTIAFISIGCALGAGLIGAGVVYFTRLGKKEIEKQKGAAK